jgi:hypothetical protein
MNSTHMHVGKMVWATSQNAGMIALLLTCKVDNASGQFHMTCKVGNASKQFRMICRSAVYMPTESTLLCQTLAGSWCKIRT